MTILKEVWSHTLANLTGNALEKAGFNDNSIKTYSVYTTKMLSGGILAGYWAFGLASDPTALDNTVRCGLYTLAYAAVTPISHKLFYELEKFLEVKLPKSVKSGAKICLNAWFSASTVNTLYSKTAFDTSPLKLVDALSVVAPVSIAWGIVETIWDQLSKSEAFKEASKKPLKHNLIAQLKPPLVSAVKTARLPQLTIPTYKFPSLWGG